MTRVVGAIVRSRRVVSRPSIPGMPTSITTTSARCISAWSIASDPVVAAPTTSIRSLRSSSVVSASANMRWSSAIRTRIGSSADGSWPISWLPLGGSGRGPGPAGSLREIVVRGQRVADLLGERLRGQSGLFALAAELLDRDVARGPDLGARDDARGPVLVPHPHVFHPEMEERVAGLGNLLQV